MAAPKKRVFKNFNTPIVAFNYPKLDAVDYGSKEYPKPDGEFSVQATMDLSDKAVKAMLAQLEILHAEAIENAKREFADLKLDARKRLQKDNGPDGIKVQPIYADIYDEETEQPTGQIKMKFSMAAGGTVKKGPREGEKWSQKPTIADARGNVMGKVPKIGGGSRGIVAFSVVEGGYFIPGTGLAGISCKLTGAQIIELVSGGQRTASSLGFKAQDGYSHDDAAASEEDETSGEEGLPEQRGEGVKNEDF